MKQVPPSAEASLAWSTGRVVGLGLVNVNEVWTSGCCQAGMTIKLISERKLKEVIYFFTTMF